MRGYPRLGFRLTSLDRAVSGSGYNPNIIHMRGGRAARRASDRARGGAGARAKQASTRRTAPPGAVARARNTRPPRASEPAVHRAARLVHTAGAGVRTRHTPRIFRTYTAPDTDRAQLSAHRFHRQPCIYRYTGHTHRSVHSGPRAVAHAFLCASLWRPSRVFSI